MGSCSQIKPAPTSSEKPIWHELFGKNKEADSSDEEEDDDYRQNLAAKVKRKLASNVKPYLPSSNPNTPVDKSHYRVSFSVVDPGWFINSLEEARLLRHDVPQCKT